MINQEEKIKQLLLRLPKDTVTRILFSVQNDFDCKTENRRNLLLADGFEDAVDLLDEYLTKDGREVLWYNENPYVLNMETHNQRREAALAAAKEENEKTETKSVAETEELSEITCPKCRDALQYSRVCPACAAGQAGYHHRYLCVCGVDFVTKERL